MPTRVNPNALPCGRRRRGGAPEEGSQGEPETGASRGYSGPKRGVLATDPRCASMHRDGDGDGLVSDFYHVQFAQKPENLEIWHALPGDAILQDFSLSDFHRHQRRASLPHPRSGTQADVRQQNVALNLRTLLIEWEREEQLH